MQAVQANPLQRPPQLRTYFSTPEQLQKDLRPLDAIRLGSLSISGYDHIPHINPLDWNKLTPQEQQVVRDNMQLVKSRKFECYYFHNPNPFIAQVQQSGQIVWKSVSPCDGRHVCAIANDLTRKGISVHVNTGNHGDAHGLIPSAGNFFEANRLGTPEFFDQDYRNLNRVPQKVSILQLSAEVRPIYPEGANCVIDAWCFSLNTAFSDIRNYLIPRDLIGHFIPTLYKDVATNQLMKKPMYSLACTRVEGRTHYYDKKTVRHLENAQPPGKAIICRLNRCAQKILPGSFYEDKKLELEICEFKQKVAEEKANIQKVSTLQGEVVAKDQRIVFLEDKVVVLEEEKTDLKGRVTDITGERDFEREAKLEALDRLNIREQRIEQLEEEIDSNRNDPGFQQLLAQEMERLNIQEKPSIQEFIKSNLLSKRYTPTQWQKKLSALKHEAEYWLAGILQGRLFDRVNAFISQGVAEDHEEKHRRIVETLLSEIKQRVIALVRNKMAYYSTDLIDTFIVGEFQVRYNNAEFKEFLEPLMEKLIKEDFLSNRVVEITKNENISIQELPRERWDEHEPGRYTPRTYKETMESILSYALQIELCDQMLGAFRE